MRILIACEESQIVTKAFRDKGHEAYSCDIEDCSGGFPEWHLHGDVMQFLNMGWDMMIAHPPCTYLSYAGIAHWNKPGRKEKREAAMEFFKALYNCDIPMIAIENPLGEPIKWKPYDQAIQPFEFGENYRKRICLWLKNLPPLMLTGPHRSVKPIYIDSTGKKRYNTDSISGGTEKGRKLRSKFFPLVAAAMAEQWTEIYKTADAAGVK